MLTKQHKYWIKVNQDTTKPKAMSNHVQNYILKILYVYVHHNSAFHNLIMQSVQNSFIHNSYILYINIVH
jgi:hypothetical protein